VLNETYNINIQCWITFSLANSRATWQNQSYVITFNIRTNSPVAKLQIKFYDIIIFVIWDSNFFNLYFTQDWSAKHGFAIWCARVKERKQMMRWHPLEWMSYLWDFCHFKCAITGINYMTSHNPRLVCDTRRTDGCAENM